jgi:uncharacterized protein
VPAKPRCPSCKKPAAPRKENASFPFCSERCKMIDLGRWLGGDYRLPGPPASDADIAGALRDGTRRDDDDDGNGNGNGHLH